MRSLIYVAMFAVALISVTMGVSLIDTTPVRIAVREPVEIRHEATPVPAAVPSPPPVAQQPAPALRQQPPAASAPAPIPAPTAQQGTPQIYQPEGQSAQSGEPPACNVAACTAAYHTFTASDCTYQPSDGPRKLCTRK